MPDGKTREELQQENEELRRRLAEAEAVLSALRSGQVDALSIPGEQGLQVFTLKGAESFYRTLIDEMNEGAVTITADGVILYCNRCFAEMLGQPQEKIAGSRFTDWIVGRRAAHPEGISGLAEPDDFQSGALQAGLQRSRVDIAFPEGSQPAQSALFSAKGSRFLAWLLQADGRSGRTEVNLSRSDGTALAASLSATWLLRDGMQVICLVITDLTEQKHREARHLEARHEDKRMRLSLLSLNEDLEQTAAHLRQSELKFRALFDYAPLAGIIYRLIRDESSGIVDWEVAEINPQGAAAIGMVPAEAIGRRASELFGAEAMQPYFELSRSVVASGQPSYIETYFPHNDRHYLAAVFSMGDDLYANVSVDITDRVRAEEAVHSIARFPSENPSPVLRLDLDGRIMYANPASQPVLNEWNCTIGELAPEFWRQQAALLSARQANQTLEYTCDANAYAVTLAYVPEAAYTNLYFANITRRKQAELRTLQISRLYNMLSQINQAIVHTRDHGRLIQAICQAAVDYGSYRMAWIGWIDEATQEVRPVAFAGEEDGYLAEVKINYLDEDLGRGPTGTAIREDCCVICQDMASDARMRPWRALALQHGYYSSAAVPIHQGGRVIGALTVYAAEPYTFDNDNENLLVEIGADISFALDALELEAEHRRAELALQESEAKFSAAFRVSPLCLGIADDGGRYVDVNQALCDLTGYSRAEMIGRTSGELEIMRPDALQQLRTDWQRSGGRVENLELDLYNRNGQSHQVIYSVSLFKINGVPHHLGAALDITARKQVEKALRESEEKYRGLLESLHSAVFLVEPDGRILYANEVANGVLGGMRGDLIGKMLGEIFPEATASRQMANLRHVLHEDRAMVNEAISEVQGQLRWFRTSLQPIHDEQGGVVSVLVNAMDIHELKTTQQELVELNRTLEQRVQERTAQVQDLYDNAPAGYHSLDADGCYLQVNQTELELLGYQRDELIGKHASLIFTPESAEFFKQTFPHFKASGQLKDVEFEVRRKDGSTFPAIVNATAIYAADGRYQASRSTLVDITERKESERCLLESEEQNRLLFEETPVAAVLLDSSGSIVRANHAFEQLSGLPFEQILGRDARVLGLTTPASYDQLCAARLQAGLEQQKATAVEHILTRTDGQVLEVESRIFPFQMNGSEHILVTMIDVSSYKQAEELLRLANLELERAMRLKDDFLANMSHELRTPLTGILGITEIMLTQIGGPLTPQQQKYLGLVDTSGRHLLSLINDILDLSKIEAGKTELEPESLAVGDICQASLAFVKELASKKSVALEFSCEPKQLQMMADARRLKQILVNLLSNAVKFTPSGGRVSLRAVGQVQDEWVRFAVTDTGIGMSPQDLTRLFTPFTQVDSGLARSHEGTGLGLALVKKLAELHGGSVAVESELGKGSTFTVSIPWRQAIELADPSDARFFSALPDPIFLETNLSKRILLAEDNDVSAMVAMDYLESSGYEVVRAVNGSEVLELLKSFNPDLILMDMQMPVLSGLEVTGRIRQMPAYQDVPIIALTALAMKGDRERCLAAGATEYLSKPINFKTLIGAIEGLLDGKK